MRRSTAATALLTALALGVLGPPATALAQPPGSDVGACRDGNCTLRVTGPVEIPLDGRAGSTGLSVSSIGPYAVAFWVHRPSGNGLGVVGRSGTVRFGSEQGSLAVRVLELGPDGAVIELTTTPA
ncbi:hypothetical protein [Pseudonocardia zijingensis]|uniref:Secreted protein n=1 Tax=Pseudonocardia zijingensis TaxID=153376 RepID=A0ABP3YLP3_9PSEU